MVTTLGRSGHKYESERVDNKFTQMSSVIKYSSDSHAIMIVKPLKCCPIRFIPDYCKLLLPRIFRNACNGVEAR